MVNLLSYYIYLDTAEKRYDLPLKPYRVIDIYIRLFGAIQ